MFFPTTKIMVERLTVMGESSTGEEMRNWVIVYASVDADLQANESELKVYTAGQTAMSHKRVFCDRLDIIEDDKITDLSNNVSHKVLSVNDHTILSHMELDVISGVY